MTIIIAILALFVIPNLVAKLLYKREKLEKIKRYFIKNKSKVKIISKIIAMLAFVFMLVDIFLLETTWLVYLVILLLGISLSIDKYLDLTWNEKSSS